MTPSRPLPWNGAITGVGSLPGTDPQAALDFVVDRAPELPFWPQLPQRGPRSAMVGQSLLDLDPFLKHDSGGACRLASSDRAAFLDALGRAEARYDEDHAPGFFAFLRALEDGRFPRARMVKAQVDGPLTLCAQLRVDDAAPIQDDPAFLEAAGRRCAALARWQVTRLREVFDPVLCVIDEPCLGLLAPGPSLAAGRAAIARVLTAIQEAGARAGLHCCGAWPAWFDPGLAAASFDDALSYESWGASEHGRRWRADRGLLILGAVPTARDERARWRPASLAERPELVRGLDRLALSASCGLGTLSWTEARAVFDRAEEAREALRAAP